MKKNKQETIIKDIIDNYMPPIFNVCELWNKIQEIYGKYNIKLGINQYKISDTTIYKYIKEYCNKLGQGQWEK